jgi:ABC-2 type transport system permease protein
MTTITSPLARQTEQARFEPDAVARTFLAVLWRDVFATTRQLPTFVAQMLVQPLLLFFVFGRVLGDAGYTHGDFGATLLPGVVALNALLIALQTTAMPLIMDFSWSGELEDRLLAPLPGPLVALAKMVYGSACGLVAGLVMAPLGFLILGGPWPLAAWPGVLLVLVLGAAAGAGLGMALGTIVSPERISVTFALVLAPLTFTGSVQYSWASLGNLGWFQVVSAVNPLTYVCEGIRAVALPQVWSIPLPVDILVLVAAVAVFGAVGVKGFMARAVN